MQAGDRARARRRGARTGARRAIGIALATIAGLVGASSPAWASPTLNATVTPATAGSVALAMLSSIDDSSAGPPVAEIASVAFTLPSELTAQLGQFPTCDPTTFVDPTSAVVVSLTNLSTGVSAPSCPAGSVLGTANAQLTVTLFPNNPLTAPSGELIHTSGAYPLTLFLNYYSPGFMTNLYLALGATVTQSGGQTIITVYTGDPQTTGRAYGIPPAAAPFAALNDIDFSLIPTSGGSPVSATGCASGLWSFSSTITYAGSLTSSNTYDTPIPPNDTASTTVPCTGGAGGGSSSGGSSGSTGGGSGGVSGTSTVTPGTSKKTVVCLVPKVARGATLSSVERALKKAHCTVGHIGKEHSANVVRKGKIVERKVPKGRVISIGDRAGTKLKVNSRVNITVSSG